MMHRENLCDHGIFTGFTRDGGYTTATIADARFAFPLGEVGSEVALAPLLCAGLIGWRSLAIAGDDGKKLGLYGFGAAAHIVAQVAKWQGRSVFAFTRPRDVATQGIARSLGATWAGGSDEMPPEPLDAAIIFATVGDLVPLALKAVRKGGRVVCAGIHMSDIPSFPYQILWEERELLSVADLTRQDGIDFLRLAPEIGIVIKTTSSRLETSRPGPRGFSCRPVRGRCGSHALGTVKQFVRFFRDCHVPEHESPVNYLRCQPFRKLAYSLLASRSDTLFAGLGKRVLLTEAPF